MVDGAVVAIVCALLSTGGTVVHLDLAVVRPCQEEAVIGHECTGCEGSVGSVHLIPGVRFDCLDRPKAGVDQLPVSASCIRSGGKEIKLVFYHSRWNKG